jgi:5-methylcytosine-specific restriction endonuclease McrA
MPRKRQPRAVWVGTRRAVLDRDGFACVRCGVALTEDTAHIDHIQSGKRGSNALSNLRSLCRRCHVLRADHRHRGLIAAALRDGIIPPEWRGLFLVG